MPVPETFHCDFCKTDTPIQTSGGTGYAKLISGHIACYDCCATLDREEVARSGEYTLYLSYKGSRPEDFKWGKVDVTNWPGTLRFLVGQRRIGRHNLVGRHYDVWFAGPDKQGNLTATWHGVTYGDNTQICHCRRVKD